MNSTKRDRAKKYGDLKIAVTRIRERKATYLMREGWEQTTFGFYWVWICKVEITGGAPEKTVLWQLTARSIEEAWELQVMIEHLRTSDYGIKQGKEIQ